MERHAYIMARKQEGRDLLKIAFEFYFLPRAGILCVLYLICSTLSRRTRSLLVKQEEASRETERISAELNVANHIQTSMLPNLFPAFPERKEFDIYASMTPAKEVGGDFYDFFMVDDRHLAVVIADVSGKGVPAALFMVIGKTLIKDHTQQGRDLGEIFTEVNELLCQSNSEGLFITAFEGVLDLDTGDFVYVNAGHDAPFICHKDGSYEPLAVKSGFVLAGMEETKFTEG
jgi:sigma-B regulation protein RsbU (phosphoserine phosphatase)